MAGVIKFKPYRKLIAPSSAAMKSRRSSASRAILSGTAIDGLPLVRLTGSPASSRFRIRWHTCGSSGGKQANQTEMLKYVSVRRETGRR